MNASFRYVMPVAVAIAAGCSGNRIDVGSVDNDAGAPDGADGNAGRLPCEYEGRSYDASGGPTSGSDASTSTACPFSLWAGPTTLGTILGVGKSPSTCTIYLADQAGGIQRVFVSGSSQTFESYTLLKRQHVSGSGSGPYFMVFTTDGPDAPITLQIDTPAGLPKRMGVYPGILKDKKTLVIGQDGEELALLSDADVTNLPIRNLTISYITEYAAATADGNFLLITRPNEDWTFNDFRVFFGPLDRMVEGGLKSATRARDGGSTTIVFAIEGGKTATAYFPVVFADGGFSPGPATLSIDPDVFPLTRLSAPPEDAYYLCVIP